MVHLPHARHVATQSLTVYSPSGGDLYALARHGRSARSLSTSRAVIEQLLSLAISNVQISLIFPGLEFLVRTNVRVLLISLRFERREYLREGVERAFISLSPRQPTGCKPHVSGLNCRGFACSTVALDNDVRRDLQGHRTYPLISLHIQNCLTLCNELLGSCTIHALSFQSL